jgi:hypothetical protein
MLEGARLGSVELPVSGALVERERIADAIAAAFHWPILMKFFSRNLAAALRLERSADGVAVWRDGCRLAAGLDEREVGDVHACIDRVGWTLFLQETWGEPAWPRERFYDPTPRRRLAAFHGCGAAPWTGASRSKSASGYRPSRAASRSKPCFVPEAGRSGR